MSYDYNKPFIASEEKTEFAELPAGIYNCKIVNVEKKWIEPKNDRPGNDVVTWSLLVSDGACAGTHAWMHTHLTEKQDWTFCAAFDRCGLKALSVGEAVGRIAECVGLLVEVQVKVSTTGYTNYYINKRLSPAAAPVAVSPAAVAGLPAFGGG